MFMSLNYYRTNGLNLNSKKRHSVCDMSACIMLYCISEAVDQQMPFDKPVSNQGPLSLVFCSSGPQQWFRKCCGH